MKAKRKKRNPGKKSQMKKKSHLKELADNRFVLLDFYIFYTLLIEVN